MTKKKVIYTKSTAELSLLQYSPREMHVVKYVDFNLIYLCVIIHMYVFNLFINISTGLIVALLTAVTVYLYHALMTVDELQ